MTFLVLISTYLKATQLFPGVEALVKMDFDAVSATSGASEQNNMKHTSVTLSASSISHVALC